MRYCRLEFRIARESTYGFCIYLYTSIVSHVTVDEKGRISRVCRRYDHLVQTKKLQMCRTSSEVVVIPISRPLGRPRTTSPSLDDPGVVLASTANAVVEGQ